MNLRQVPAWGWYGAVVVVGLGVLVWHDWRTGADDDAKWLDPEQPPLQLDAPSASLPSVRPRQRCYPDSLAAWAGTKIGDC